MFDPYRPRAPTQENMLMDAVRRLEKLRENRIAVHVHLSSLTSTYKRDHCLRIATELFITCVGAFEGQLFSMENSDIIFLAKNASIEMLDNAVNRLRVLFSEDPLARFNVSEEERPRFCSWYILENDYEGLLEAAQSLLEQAEGTRQKPELDPGVDQSKLTGPIRPEVLTKLEQVLENADVSNFVRRQTVCTIIEKQPPQPLFEEIYVSIEDLQGITTPGIDLLANRWLFQYLTQTLDRRVMSMIIRDGVNSSRPFSLNLNVATVLSPEFARFESIVTPQLRGRLVIEMDKIDVFSDMGAFIFARDYLHDRGFRICLDGLTHHTLPYYDRSRLGFDLIKIYWTPGSIDDMLPEMVPAIRSIVMESGQARTILCRCDSPRAIEMGQNLGIVMFQGRYVERIANPVASTPSPYTR